MSDNSNNPQFDPVEKEKQKEENIDKPENPSQPPMSKNQDSCPEDTSESESTNEEENEKGDLLEGTKSEEEQTGGKAKNISANKSEKQIVADDEDGFKTPTSSEHRIPAIEECPPAPRKHRPSRWKRRRSPPPEARRCLEFDALGEVESLQPVPDIDDEDNAEEPKYKKARRDDDDDNEDLS